MYTLPALLTNTKSTLNCKILSPCIGIYDLVLGLDVVLPKCYTGETLNWNILSPCIRNYHLVLELMTLYWHVT